MMNKYFLKYAFKPGNKISPKFADFSAKNRMSAAMEKRMQWKNRAAENRRKIGIFRRFFADFSIRGDFPAFCRAVCARAEEARRGPILSAINAKCRRFLGDFSGIYRGFFLALGFFQLLI